MTMLSRPRGGACGVRSVTRRRSFQSQFSLSRSIKGSESGGLDGDEVAYPVAGKEVGSAMPRSNASRARQRPGVANGPASCQR